MRKTCNLSSPIYLLRQLYNHITTTTITIMSPNQRVRFDQRESSSSSNPEMESGILNESVLIPVLESLLWDLHTLCSLCAVSRKFQAIGKRVLWRHFNLHRAPKMVSTLTATTSSSSTHHRLLGGWFPLAKLLLYCCGYEPTGNFRLDRKLTGHFCKATRFSKTSGTSFLSKRCRGDVLYVSDPCEHVIDEEKEEELLLGVYRGVFREFMRSKTRAVLVERRVGLEEERVRCPYCRARVWSMTGAKMVPATAWTRLGASRGDGSSSTSSVEYFVCINGHLYGACWLARLSSDDDDDVDNDEEGSGGDDGEDD